MGPDITRETTTWQARGDRAQPEDSIGKKKSFPLFKLQVLRLLNQTGDKRGCGDRGPV